jgi:phospholipid/cholesterol/gamma-HCH transport system substrate-binding protein
LLTPFVRRQLILFIGMSVVAVLVLGVYYLQVPTLVGIGRYNLKANLTESGGLYKTANVTFRGVTIGKVTDIQPTETGAQATMSIDSRYKVPIDSIANVHSVSAVGEQYLDLTSPGNPSKYLSDGGTITKSTVPAQIGPLLDAANRGLAVLPKEKISQLLDETAQSVGGLGPALQRLVDSTQAIVKDFGTNIDNVDDIIQNSTPILDSQVNSSNAIERWARNLKSLAAQTAQNDGHLSRILSQAPPTADQVAAAFGDVRETLPQTLANLSIVTEMLKRYHTGIEQFVVFLPQGASIAQTVATSSAPLGALDVATTINDPPPCLTGFIPASQWRSPADTNDMPVPKGMYCKIPKDTPANGVRGARNFPCVDVPGKRAATPKECRDPRPYVPAGTNPWYGDPNQIKNCPAPGARCDQPITPGLVEQAPSVDTGLNPAPADRVPGTPPPVSDPLQRPGSGTVQCNGQQPNPCAYTPGGPPTAIYSPQSGELVGPDGVKYSVQNSSNTGDDGWKEMLAPAGG